MEYLLLFIAFYVLFHFFSICFSRVHKHQKCKYVKLPRLLSWILFLPLCENEEHRIPIYVLPFQIVLQLFSVITLIKFCILPSAQWEKNLGGFALWVGACTFILLFGYYFSWVRDKNK